MKNINLEILWMAANCAVILLLLYFLVSLKNQNEYIGGKYEEWICELNENDLMQYENDSLKRVVFHQKQFFEKFINGHFHYVPCLKSAESAFKAYMNFNINYVDTNYQEYFINNKKIR